MPTLCPHFPLRLCLQALAALAVAEGQHFTILISCLHLSLLFFTFTSPVAAGILCSARKPYLGRLFPAAGPGILENSFQRLCITFMAEELWFL